MKSQMLILLGALALAGCASPQGGTPTPTSTTTGSGVSREVPGPTSDFGRGENWRNTPDVLEEHEWNTSPPSPNPPLPPEEGRVTPGSGMP